MELTTPAQFVRGVGPRRAELLGRLGIATVRDLLWHLPRAWLDRSRISTLDRLVPGAEGTAIATVLRLRTRPTRRGITLILADVEDETGTASVTWFNQPYLARQLKAGRRILLSGPVRLQDRRLEFVHPEFEFLEEGGEGRLLSGGRLVPVYPLSAGLTQKMMRLWIRTALDACLPLILDPIPAELRERASLPGLGQALEQSHFPDSEEMRDRSRHRLVFEEFLLLQLAFGLVRQRRGRPRSGRPLAGAGSLAARLRAGLGFDLTSGQEQVLSEILSDMQQDRPMNRLLQGDVGSGKTVVAAIACLTACEAGCQAAYLAPTEILAEQQADTLERWFGPLGVSTALLLGRTPKAGRREILRRTASGAIGVLIGTHALLEKDVVFRDLALIVVDEQHRFGVLQRASMREKGGSMQPHCLVMSATPIPRTLSMTLYGDLDISLLREMPAGRIPPRTRIVPEEKRASMVAWVSERLREGERAFFVYPLVEESEQLDLRDATRMAEALSSHPAMDGIGVGLLHGRMKGEDKSAVVERFRSGETPCLVTTTVVEVGVNVPQATIMVIEHPERFGLSQLHQLRGRVGRGGGESHFLLVDPGGESHGRLGILVRESDGFRVAEADLRLRGPGDFLGTAQHGLPELKVADLIRDPAVLMAARAEAEAILRVDPDLRVRGHEPLRAEILRVYANRLPLSEVG